MKLEMYLSDLERRIDPDDETRLEREWLDFADGKLEQGAFTPARRPVPPGIAWERMLINDALADDTAMLYRELYMVSELLAKGGGELLSVRSNYGTGILPATLGARPFLMPDDADTLPGSPPLAGGEDALFRAINKGADRTLGYAGRVFSTAQRYLELARAYPKISRFVHYYNPDLQGPLSLVEATWGSDCYLALYDDPDAFEAALDFFTDLYEQYLDEWFRLCPPFDAEHGVEWGCLHRGHIILRNDSATNISGDTYRAFIRPRDQRLLRKYGGGLHFCGRGHHYLPVACEMDALDCVNLSQPELNDMDIVYGCTVDRGIKIIGLPVDEARRALDAGRAFRGRVHVGAQIAAYREENAAAR